MAYARHLTSIGDVDRSMNPADRYILTWNAAGMKWTASSIHSFMNRTFYVDAVNGDDNNDGSSSAPFKTIKKAIDSVPVGGKGVVYLMEGTHVLSSHIFIGGKQMQIKSLANDSDAVTITSVAYDSNGDGIDDALHSFFLYENGILLFDYVTIEVPEASNTTNNFYDGLIVNFYNKGGFSCVFNRSSIIQNSGFHLFRLSQGELGIGAFGRVKFGFQTKITLNDGTSTSLITASNSVFSLTVDATVTLQDALGNALNWSDVLYGVIYRTLSSGEKIPINIISNIEFS